MPSRNQDTHEVEEAGPQMQPSDIENITKKAIRTTHRRRSVAKTHRYRAEFSETDDDSDDELLPPVVHVDLFNVPLGMQFALKSACKSFALFYFVRFGATYILHVIKSMRTKGIVEVLRWFVTNDLDNLIGEEALRGRVPAVQWAQVAGAFTFIFHVVRKFVNDKFDDDRLATFYAGFLGGFSLFFYDRASFRNLALYMFARLLKALYSAARSRGVLENLGLTDESHLIRNGNFHIFAIASAQIMYSYAMAPHTLGESYWKFIVRMGPVSAPAITALRQLHSSGAAAIDAVALQDGLLSVRGFPADKMILADVFAAVRHGNPGTVVNTAAGLPSQLLPLLFQVFIRSASQALPLYAALQAIPAVLLRLKAWFRSPVKQAATYTLSVMRSTVFMGMFPTIYVTVPLLQMALMPTKAPFMRNKLIFWLAGWLASLSILFERDSRRGELTLYALSMGINCAFNTLQTSTSAHKMFPFLPTLMNLLPTGLGELAVYCVSMGGLSYFYHHEKDERERSLFGTVYGRIVRSHNQKVILNPGQEVSVATKVAHGPNIKILKTVSCGASESDSEDNPPKISPTRTLVAKNRRIGSHCKLDSLDSLDK